MKILIFIFTALLLSSCSSVFQTENSGYESSHWKLIYYNSDDGRPLEGDISNLIKAVKNGEHIRIVMELNDIAVAADANYLWVKNGTVYAQNNNSISAKFDGDELIYQIDSYYYMFIVDTHGIRNTIRWSVGKHEMRGEGQDRVFIKWFVEK